MVEKLHPITEGALAKVLPLIRGNPSLLEGMGFHPEDIEAVRTTGNIKLRLLQNAASNHMFDDNLDRFNITFIEGGALRSYFQHELAEDEKERDLRKNYPYLI